MKLVLLVMAVALAGCGGKVSDEDYALKTCHFCKEEVKGGALKCKHCGSDPYNRDDSQRLIDDAFNSSLDKVREGKSKSSDDGKENQTSDDPYAPAWYDSLLTWGCPILVILAVLILAVRILRYDIDPDLILVGCSKDETTNNEANPLPGSGAAGGDGNTGGMGGEEIGALPGGGLMPAPGWTDEQIAEFNAKLNAKRKK